MIPPEAAVAIGRVADLDHVSIDTVDVFERSLRHDVMSMTRALAEAAGPDGRWVHFGATSVDITDTALALELKESAVVLRQDLTELARALVGPSEAPSSDAPRFGRTHGQHGIPISFGYKAAVGAAEVMRSPSKVGRTAPPSRGREDGGSGRHGRGLWATRGRGRDGRDAPTGPDRRRGPDPARGAGPTRRIHQLDGARRPSTAERLSTRRFATCNAPRSRRSPSRSTRSIRSAAPRWPRNGTRSSPRTSSSLARLVRAFALPPLENMVQWHERDLANSANERIVIPHAIVLEDDLLSKLVDIFRGLHVYRSAWGRSWPAPAAQP